MTDDISFTSRKKVEKKTFKSKPVFYIDKMTFISPDAQWVPRLYTAMLKIKIIGIDKNDKEIKSSEEPITFGQYITPYHKQPVFSVHRYFRHQDILKQNIERAVKWTVTINLENVSLGSNESISVHYFDSAHVEKRIDNWKTRIKHLYKQIQDWVDEKPHYAFEKGKPVEMYEELMQNFDVASEKIDTADIFYENKIMASIKPRGLWIVGVNGAIDVITPKGSYIIADQAKQFNEPQWLIYPNTGNMKNTPFNKTEFLNLIS